MKLLLPIIFLGVIICGCANIDGDRKPDRSLIGNVELSDHVDEYEAVILAKIYYETFHPLSSLHLEMKPVDGDNIWSFRHNDCESGIPFGEPVLWIDKISGRIFSDFGPTVDNPIEKWRADRDSNGVK